MQVSIETYQDKDLKEMVPLLVSAFQSKFLHRQSLCQSDIENILYALWDIQAEDASYLHFVAKVKKKIVGVILVQYKPLSKKQTKFPFFRLSRQYGFFPMLLLLGKLFMLKTSRFEECYIEHIAVDESMRGNGIGEQLISHCEELLIKMGYPSLTLAVAADNPAKHLYHRLGFQDEKYTHDGSKEFLIGIGQWILMKKPFS